MSVIRRSLGWCNHCKENSVATKINKGKGYRFDYCLNKGCGYKSTTDYPMVIHNADGDRVVNIEFKPAIKPTQIREICECGMTIDEAERTCLYVSTDCKTYCVRNAMNERGVPYE